jgi:hypothetical protein
VLKPVQRATNYRTFVADEVCYVGNAGKTRAVPVHKNEYIPLTKYRNPNVLQATVKRKFGILFSLSNDNVASAEPTLSTESYHLTPVKSCAK